MYFFVMLDSIPSFSTSLHLLFAIFFFCTFERPMDIEYKEKNRCRSVYLCFILVNFKLAPYQYVHFAFCFKKMSTISKWYSIRQTLQNVRYTYVNYEFFFFSLCFPVLAFFMRPVVNLLMLSMWFSPINSFKNIILYVSMHKKRWWRKPSNKNEILKIEHWSKVSTVGIAICTALTIGLNISLCFFYYSLF